MADLIERDALLLKQKAHADLFADSTVHDDIVRRDEATAALAEIINAPAINLWIPCEDELPTCNGCYLVWRPHFYKDGDRHLGEVTVCYFDGQDTWHDSYGVDFSRVLGKDDITHWMPLPSTEGLT